MIHHAVRLNVLSAFSAVDAEFFVYTGGALNDDVTGKAGDTIIRTSASGPLVISRGGTSRVPVVRPLITSGMARSRVPSSVIRTTLSQGTGSMVVNSTKALRHIVPVTSLGRTTSSVALSSSQMVSHQPKTATVTRVHGTSKLVTGQGTVSLIQVRPSNSQNITQGHKVVPGPKVAPVQPKVVKSTASSAVAMIDPQPVKPAAAISSSSSLSQSSTAAHRPLGEATVARADTSAKTSTSNAQPAQGGNMTQATDQFGEFDGLFTSALEDLNDIVGHSSLDEFSRPIAAAGPVRGGAGEMRGRPTDMPVGYGYAAMERQFQHPVPMQNPYLPYGMPPPPAYPWIPPAMNVNPLWMQQPIGGQPMAGPVGSQPLRSRDGGSALTSRSSGSDSFPHSDNFDLDGSSFEPLSTDANRSLTSLLADSEPPGGFDMNFSRRNAANNPGYMPPSYPGPPMISGYHPYHPYPPMPYTAPHPPQKSHYYPPPPSVNAQFCNPPGSGFAPPTAGYFPMHYPAAVPGHGGMYPGSGGAGYIPPGSAMIPTTPSYGLPAPGIAPPAAGESLTDFLLKTND